MKSHALMLLGGGSASPESLPTLVPISIPQQPTQNIPQATATPQSADAPLVTPDTEQQSPRNGTLPKG